MRERKASLKELGFTPDPVHYDEFEMQDMEKWAGEQGVKKAERPKLKCVPMEIRILARNDPPPPNEAFVYKPPKIPEVLRGGRAFDSKIHMENKKNCPFDGNCSECRIKRHDKWLDCHQYYIMEKENR